MQLQLAIGHLRQGRPDAAKNICRQLLKREPSNMDAVQLLLTIYQQEQDAEQVIELLRHVRTVAPGDPSLRIQLGTTLVDAGRLDEARAEFLDALAIWPEASDIHARLAGISRFTEHNAEVSRLEALHAASPGNSNQRRNYAFTLGKIFDELDDCETAFGYFEEANAIVRDASNYRIEADVRLFDAILEVFDADFFARHQPPATDSMVPIFIVGMPRTGTTLLEQIFASHPEVYGAGELRTLSSLITAAGQQSGNGFPGMFQSISSAQLASIAAQYVDRVGALAGGHQHVVDKNMHLFLHVGVMYALFSAAPIIHCRRNPLDASLSLFMRDMPNQPYGYGLDLVGRFSRLFYALMDYWAAIQPGRLIEVDYEDLVSEPEVTVRDLLRRCGLDYSESCLRFHESGRSVGTASNLQVRQPVHRKSVGGWKRYEAHLGPLQAALAGDGGQY